MIKYKVNGEYLDQFKLENFAISKAISKIGEIDLRHGDRSTSFDVPLTANNIRILRYTPELNNYTTVNNFDAYDGQLIEDDAVISDGYYQVVKFSPTTKKASLRFYGGNSAWYGLLKDRFINQEVLPSSGSKNTYILSDSNHEYSEDSIAGSWDLDRPYFYFLRDNGKNSTQQITNNAPRSSWGLSYRQDYLLQKIFSSVDVKLKGDLFNDPSYYTDVITSDKDVEDILPTSNNQSSYRVADNIFTVPNEAPGEGGVINFVIGSDNPQWNGNTFTANKNITDLKIFFRIKTKYNANVLGLKFFYKKNGGLTTSGNMTVESTAQGVGTIYTIDFSLGPFSNVVPGDTFAFTFGFQGPIGLNLLGEGGQYSIVDIKEEGVNPEVKGSELLPKIKQTDFIKDIMLRYGVVSQYDIKTRTLTLNKFEKIANKIPNAPDWSSKIDLSKDINVDYSKILKGYAKKSIFAYADDTDKDNDLAIFKALNIDGLGNGIINIENDFLTDEKEVYKSPFAATANRYSFPYNLQDDLGKWYVPSIPTSKISGEDNGVATYDINEIKPRVLKACKIPVRSFNRIGQNTLSIDLIGSTANYSQVGYAYMSKVFLNGLDNQYLNNLTDNCLYTNKNDRFFVGETLIERNYNLYRKILNNPFYVSLNLNLSSLDVQSVDFLTPIYLEYKYDSGYYYIDSIEQYKGDGSTTKVNLVKI